MKPETMLGVSLPVAVVSRGENREHGGGPRRGGLRGSRRGPPMGGAIGVILGVFRQEHTKECGLGRLDLARYEACA